MLDAIIKYLESKVKGLTIERCKSRANWSSDSQVPLALLIINDSYCGSIALDEDEFKLEVKFVYPPTCLPTTNDNDICVDVRNNDSLPKLVEIFKNQKSRIQKSRIQEWRRASK